MGISHLFDSGDGHGYGHGNGYGRSLAGGDGYGVGSGGHDGYGHGDALGSGEGYGDGHGYGKEYGAGHGYGYGSAPEDKQAYADSLISCYDSNEGIVAYWRATRENTPANGGSGGPRTIGAVEEVDGPLIPCSRHALHATTKPWEWSGEKLFVVRMLGNTIVDNNKICALRREILAEIVPNPF